jgi:hypothetical protein
MPSLLAPLTQPYDFGTTKVVLTAATGLLVGTTVFINGLTSISDIGNDIDSSFARGTANRIYGQTPGVVTPKDVTFEVLLSQWSSITAMFGFTELVYGSTLLDIKITNKMPGIAVKDVIGHILNGCKLVSHSTGVASGADAITYTFTVRPTEVLDLSALSALGTVIRSGL